jgi:hypothetical protein
MRGTKTELLIAVGYVALVCGVAIVLVRGTDPPGWPQG